MRIDFEAFRGRIAELGDFGDGRDQIDRAARRAWMLLGALLLAVLLLTAVFPVEGAVVASGQVSVDSRVKTITHPIGGVLAELRVREGDHVREGQTLMRLDQSVLGPNARDAALSRDQLLALRARLEAERDDRPRVDFPPELIGNPSPSAQVAMEQERRQFELGRRERDGSLALLNQRIRQAQEQIRSYRVQIDATRQQLKLIQPELEGLRSLKERGLVTITRLNQMERTAVQLSGTEASLEANIAQAEAQISEIGEQILNVDQNRRVQAGSQLTDAIAQLAEQNTRAVQSEDVLKRTVIVAPQEGVVDNIAYTTIGSAIPANQPILQIVPLKDKLVVTARVAPDKVDALRVGQRARVRFSTLERQLSPEIVGRVAWISAERTDDPQLGSFYRVRVELSNGELTRALGGTVRAGQPAEVYFTTGRRSILSYALKPLLDQMRKAARE
jgi:HlyD family secretion protein